MTIPELTEKMIAFSEGNLHDIVHFLKVWAFARTIGQLEKLDERTQFVLEVAALVHDIACPLCREKYGNTNGKYQEIEGEPLTRAFFADTDLSQSQIDRIAFLVAHHHTYTDVAGLDYQILLEADYLVNADESGYSRENIENFAARVFKTESRLRILREMYFGEN